MEPRSPRGSRRRAGGFTYLGILLAVVLLGIALGAAGTVWSVTAQRERETQLLFAGDAIREAIASYYGSGPVAHQLPRELTDLLQDDREPRPRHHLRQLYPDPLTGKTDWQLLRDPDGGIFGVSSSSQGAPLKRANFSEADTNFTGAKCYCDWRFEFVPSRRGLAPQRR
jgi:type II secretory pathway pseudopilin PulG